MNKPASSPQSTNTATSAVASQALTSVAALRQYVSESAPDMPFAMQALNAGGSPLGATLRVVDVKSAQDQNAPLPFSLYMPTGVLGSGYSGVVFSAVPSPALLEQFAEVRQHPRLALRLERHLMSWGRYKARHPDSARNEVLLLSLARHLPPLLRINLPLLLDWTLVSPVTKAQPWLIDQAVAIAEALVRQRLVEPQWPAKLRSELERQFYAIADAHDSFQPADWLKAPMLLTVTQRFDNSLSGWLRQATTQDDRLRRVFASVSGALAFWRSALLQLFIAYELTWRLWKFQHQDPSAGNVLVRLLDTSVTANRTLYYAVPRKSDALTYDQLYDALAKAVADDPTGEAASFPAADADSPVYDVYECRVGSDGQAALLVLTDFGNSAFQFNYSVPLEGGSGTQTGSTRRNMHDNKHYNRVFAWESQRVDTWFSHNGSESDVHGATDSIIAVAKGLTVTDGNMSIQAKAFCALLPELKVPRPRWAVILQDSPFFESARVLPAAGESNADLMRRLQHAHNDGSATLVQLPRYGAVHASWRTLP